MGLQEAPGAADNPAVVKLFSDCGHPEVHHDETAWCAAFVGSCLKRSGFPVPPVATNLLARSYLTYGTKCEAKKGAIAVFPRGAPPLGHVGMVIEVRGDEVVIVSGNTGDKVAVESRAISSALGFRWPVAPTVKALRAAGSTDMHTASTVKQTGVAVGAIGAAAAAVQQAATPPIPPVVPDISLDHVSTQVSTLKTISEGANAILHLLLGSPWLVAVALVGALLFFVARHIERARVERALLGHPLSVSTVDAGQGNAP
jgi:uncharacterized protein (TIGR02594 family)